MITVSKFSQFLKDRFPEGIGIEPGEVCLIYPGCSREEIALFEKKIGFELPISFRNLIEKYQFGALSLSYVSFGNLGNYINNLDSFNSSRVAGDAISEKYLHIGFSENYIFLLNCSLGGVYAVKRGKLWDEAELIASDFEMFIRGIGSFVTGELKMENLAAMINEVGGSSFIGFWADFAQSAT